MQTRQFERYLQFNNIVIILIFLGFLSGMILAFVAGDGESGDQLLWLDHILMYLKYGEIRYGDVLFYVIKHRLFCIFIIIILCLPHKGKYLLLSAVCIAGGFVGYYISQFVMAKGILGSVLFALSIFPHYFFYGYGYYCLLLYLFKKRAGRSDINQNSQKESNLFYKRENNIVKKVVPFAVVIIGILLECYVNPFFLKLFLKIFM